MSIANARRRQRLGCARHSGFSLVEIMVGMVIGMLGVIVMMQMFAVSEGQKRTTTSGADAQGNGLVALNTIERDLRMAGYGLANSNVFGASGCTNILGWYNGAATTMSAASVTIADGGTGLPDTISMAFGNAMGGAIPATITQTMPSSSAELNVSRTTGFAQNDLIVVAQNGVCVMMQVTQVQSAALKLQHNPGGNALYNPTVPQTPASWPAYTTGALIFNLGQMTRRTYSVDASRSLQVLDLNATAPLTLVSNIVNIQAQYGIAEVNPNPGTLDPNGQVTCWVNATAAGNACDASDWSNPTSANVARIKAVRIAVVARSTLPEKPSVTGGTCDATSAAPISWSGGPTIDLSADANWKCYRYKVYQTIVPLRNVIWANL